MLLLKSPYPDSSGGAPPSDPPLTNLVLWLKADALALSDTDPVSSWTDSSGQGHTATQGTGGQQPIYHTGIQNGQPGVQFDTDDTLITSLALPNEPLTAFAVVQWTASSGSRGSVLGHTGAEPYKRWWWGSDSDTKKLSTYKGNGTDYDSDYDIGSLAMDTSHRYLVGLRTATGGVTTMWTNGGPAVDAGVLSKTATPTIAVSPQYQQGAVIICELLLYSAALDDATITLLRAYVNGKYALY